MKKHWIFYVVILFLICFCIITSLNYSKLQDELSEYKKLDYIENKELLDENQHLKQEIDSLNLNLIYYQHKIDSLKEVKQKVVIIETFFESETLTDGVKILKYNLSCEK